MLKFVFRSWIKTMPWRVALGVMLCANYSCTSNKSMVSKDPFQQGGQHAGELPDDPLMNGNHNLLAKGSHPLPGSPQSQPGPNVAGMSPEKAAKMQQEMLAQQQAMAQHHAIAQQQAESHRKYAELQASMQQLQANKPAEAGDDEAATVRVAKEWPALPEQHIGMTPPDQQAPSIDGMPSLPAGGYDKPLSESDPWTQAGETKTAGLSNHSAVQTAAAETGTEDPSGGFQPVSFEEYMSSQDGNAAGSASMKPQAQKIQPVSHQSNFTPADPRVPLEGASSAKEPGIQVGNPQPCPPFPGSPQAACGTCGPGCGHEFYPDEYLCDGGDRGLPVHYSPGFREGLETQDTIVEYTDEQGEQQLKKTNEVCVYAPRFGAVKTVAGSSENVNIDRALGTYESVNGVAVNTEMIPITEEQTTQLTSARVRSRVSGLETEDVTLGVNQATKLADHTKLQNTNTDYGFVAGVGIDNPQTPVTLAGIQAAMSWTRKQSPVIVASDVGGTELYSWFKGEELVGLEDKSTPGRLYVDKLADKGNAKPGDVITFTIRYRNVGDRSLFNVQVIDNLTPRLEFIEGSATSNRDGRLVVEDNQEGSLILKWEISEELEGRSNGVVTFKARVR